MSFFTDFREGESEERKAIAINQTIEEASMARSKSTGDYAVFNGLARLADTLEDERIVLEIEIPMVMEWVVRAGDLLRGICIPSTLLMDLSMKPSRAVG
jgi:hypothetical protein